MLLTSSPSRKEVFYCPEESNFYSFCIENLVLQQCQEYDKILEFGAGDGSPVIKSLLNTNFQGIIHGFELNPLACQAAKAKIARHNLSDLYKIHNQSFFEGIRPLADYLISNPPYLPAADNQLYQPLLHGGIDGITLTKKLLSLGYKNVMMMVSSYSNPQGLIESAIAQGYCVSAFTISPLPFGYYSSEPKVMKQISNLRKRNRAFYSQNIYLLAGVLFTKVQKSTVDISAELLRLLTAL